MTTPDNLDTILEIGATALPHRKSCRTSGTLPPAYGYAGFWERAGALVLDVFIMAIPSAILGYLFSSAFQTHMTMRGSDPVTAALGGTLWAKFAGIGVSWVYFAAMESSRYCGTIGKQIVGLRVADLEGHSISFGKATGRFFGRFVSAIPLGIGFLVQPFTARRQTWHDMIAGCTVLRRAPGEKASTVLSSVRESKRPVDPKSRYEHLAMLKRLRDDEALTEEEYQTEKRKVLDS